MTERTQTTFSFNVSNYNKPSLKLITKIKKQCKHRGISFSWYCLQALKSHYKEQSNG